MQAKALRSDAFLLASFLALLTFSRIIWLYVSGHDLYGDEAQYWLWSKSIAFGYYSKPPVVAWVIHLSTSIFGDAEWAIRIASPLTHTLISIIIYFIALELFNKKTALWSAITYITLPAVFVSSGFISTDPFLMLFWALSFLAYIKAIRTDSLKWWILLGVSAGFGMLTKYSMGIFLIAVLAHLVASKQYLKVLKSYKIWAGGAIAFAMWFPNLLWNYNNSMASFNHTYDLAKGRADSFLSFSSVLAFFTAQFAVFGPILFSAYLYSFRKIEIKKNLLPLIFSLTFLVIIIVLSFVSRAHANWAAPAYVAATILVVNFLLSHNKLNLLKISFMLHLVLGISLLSYTTVIQVFDVEISRNTDPFRRLRGFKEIGDQLDTYRMMYPNAVWAADDRMNLSSFVYYTKPHAFDFKKWNPAHQIKDHFDLTTSLKNDKSKDVIVISDYYGASALSHYGSSVKEVGCLYYSPYAGLERNFKLVLIRDFKGY